MPEFVNPKYTDSTKTLFTKPTRLECLMQDFPRLIMECSKVLKKEMPVGFTKFDRWLCFTCVKNNIADAIKKSAALQPEDCCLSAE